MAEISRGQVNYNTVAGSIGLAGAAMPVLQSLFGGWNNGYACSENMPVNRYEAAQNARISELETEVKLRDANTYTDQKMLELYKYFDGKMDRVDHKLCEQAVWNTAQTGTISCMAQQIAALQGLTKLVVPNSSICPGWGDVTVTVTPATTTTTTG